MKTKIVLFIAVTALTTLSFTFSTMNERKAVKVDSKPANEPIGGLLLSEDKF